MKSCRSAVSVDTHDGSRTIAICRMPRSTVRRRDTVRVHLAVVSRARQAPRRGARRCSRRLALQDGLVPELAHVTRRHRWRCASSAMVPSPSAHNRSTRTRARRRDVTRRCERRGERTHRGARRLTDDGVTSLTTTDHDLFLIEPMADAPDVRDPVSLSPRFA